MALVSGFIDVWLIQEMIGSPPTQNSFFRNILLFLQCLSTPCFICIKVFAMLEHIFKCLGVICHEILVHVFISDFPFFSHLFFLSLSFLWIISTLTHWLTKFVLCVRIVAFRSKLLLSLSHFHFMLDYIWLLRTRSCLFFLIKWLSEFIDHFIYIWSTTFSKLFFSIFLIWSFSSSFLCLRRYYTFFYSF